MKTPLFLAAAFFCLLTSGEEVLYNAGNYFGGFQVPRRLENRIENGLLVLRITGRDSGIINPEVNLNPKRMTILEIRYRATGIPEKTTGQLYFAGPGADFDGRHVWILPSLVNDGEFHTLQTPAPLSWKQLPSIRKLRLDMIDQGPGGKIEIAFIRLRSPGAGEMPAEWPAVKPQIPKAAPVSRVVPAEYYTAAMVSAPEDTSEKPGDYYLRKHFSAPAAVEGALLQIAVDDKYQLYFNGRLLDDQMLRNSWKEPKAYDVTALVRPASDNVVAVKYRNEGGPGGVLLEVALLGKDGVVRKYRGQDECLSSARFEENWTSPDFPDASWKKPLVHGTPPAPPWTRVLPYQTLRSHRRIRVHDVKLPSVVEAGERVRLFLAADAPDGECHVRLSLKSEKGKTIRSYSGKAELRGGKLVYAFQTPRFFSSMPMYLDLSLADGELEGLPEKLHFQYRQKNCILPNPAVTVMPDEHGMPQIAVNGVRRYCIIGNDLGNKITPSVFAPVPADFRICSLLQNNAENEWQTAPGEYDFSVADRIMDHMLECDRKALVILAVGMEPPAWWAERYPGELTLYSDQSKCFFHTISPSFASAVWKEHALNALRALIRHLEEAPYAPRIGGVLLTNGKTYEWQYWGGHESGKMGKMVDYSPPMHEYFRNRMKAELPPCGERLSAGKKVFFDPAADRLKIAANRMQSETLSQFMIDALKSARSSFRTPKLIGVYYGYHFEYAGYLWTRQLCGHNDLARVLREGKPDFIFSPPSYAVRHLGETCGDMKPFKSIENAGCLSIIDDDTRTHTIPYSLFSQTMTAEQTRNILRRNFGMALCRGQNLCVLPLNGGNEFDSPETIRDLEIIRKAGNDALRGRKSCRAEIAVVVDEKSFDYLAFDNVCYRNFPRREYRADGSVSSYYAETLRLTGNLVSFQRARLEKIGAPVDYLLASDVAANAGNYKFWIFLDVFTADEAFREAVRKLRKDRNVLLWFYAPGVIDGDTFGEENIRKLTGISVREVSSGRSPEILLPDGQIAGMPEKIPLLYSPDDSAARILGSYLDSGLPGAAEKMTGSARDIFWGGNVVPVSLLRDFARKAGVHIYSDNGDVLFAGNGFLTFHAASAGEKTIRLPEESTVSDLFSGSAVLKQGKCFSFKAKLHETRIFRIREK